MVRVVMLVMKIKLNTKFLVSKEKVAKKRALVY